MDLCYQCLPGVNTSAWTKRQGNRCRSNYVISDSWVKRLSHNCHKRILDCDVCMLYCWSSLGDGVDRLCVSRRSTAPGDDWCNSILTWAVVDRRISILAVQTRDYSLNGPQWYRVGIALFDGGHPSFWNFHLPIPVYVVRVKSCVNSLFNPACVPMRVSINKFNFVRDRIVPDRTSVLWNIGWLCSSKPHLPIVFLNPLKQRSCCLSNEHLTTLAGNLVDYSILFSSIDIILRSH